MDDSLATALKILEKRLKPIRWILIGSSALYLRGLDVDFHDIDIITDAEDANKANELLKEYEVRPVIYSEKGIFRSYFGQFKINGMKVEVMGDLEYKYDGKWSKSSDMLTKTETIEYNGFKCLVLPLEMELDVYSKFGREKDKLKLKKIEEMLKEIR